ncbi:hypothetical protein BDP81DRAFT_441755 [Colletotrichum phormii]|uniref:Uncharacterized protein n=1 Tax=Colletotrichum phormii TaxID=359342 RepID=A0AAI9ZF10_9PEZI|nr:uncharacterized protein BDP81DRAFT_441755 [Colletotrichum phormii]KAK1622251.1 hypothetical protein BDP81DRAFT_441755 [Colletotrichum phormii]
MLTPLRHHNPSPGISSHARTNGIEDRQANNSHASQNATKRNSQQCRQDDPGRHLHFFDHKTTIIQVLL